MCGVVASMTFLPPLPILATNIASRARGADSVGTFYYTRTHVRGYTVRRRHVPGGPGGRPARTAQRLRREVGDGGGADARTGRHGPADPGPDPPARRRRADRVPGGLGARRALGGGAADEGGGGGGRGHRHQPGRLRPRARQGGALGLWRLGPGRCRSGPGHDRPAGRRRGGAGPRRDLLLARPGALDRDLCPRRRHRGDGGRGGAAPRRAAHAEPVPGRGPPGGDPSRPGAGRAGRPLGGQGARMVAKQALDGRQPWPTVRPRLGRAHPDRPGGRRGDHLRRPPTPAAPTPGRMADDERTLGLDQRRFDALVTICAAALGRPDAPAGRAGVRPTVYLYADVATWAGLAEHPVELDGYGVIPAGAAREHFTDARWRASVTDAAGAVTAVPRASYTPSADLNRQLHVADRRCGFPSCGAAVWFCDADHNRPYDSGGCTDADNCGLLCRRHHRLKTFTTWSWRRGADGAIEWIDPNGVRWDREPIRYLMPDVPESDVSESEVPDSDVRHQVPDRLPVPAHPVRVDPLDRPGRPAPPGPGSEGLEPVVPAAEQPAVSQSRFALP